MPIVLFNLGVLATKSRRPAPVQTKSAAPPSPRRRYAPGDNPLPLMRHNRKVMSMRAEAAEAAMG
jgi:hypothetical protein